MADKNPKQSAKNNKNSVVVKNPPKKKKRSCCCSCLLTLFIVVVVVLGAGTGVGWYVGDKWLKENIDMSMKDTLGVVSDLLTAKEKKIVTNSHKDTSADAFTNELKKQLYLKETANIDLNELVSMLSSSNETEETSDTKNSYLHKALNALGAVDTETEGDGESSGVNLDFITNLFTKENIDLERLSAYDDADPDSNKMTLTDKQFAAFVSQVLASAMDDGALDKSLGDIKQYLGDTKMSEILLLDQIIFSGTEEDPHLKLTASVDMRKIAAGAIANATGMNLAWAVKPFLPVRIFVTIDLKLVEDGELKIYINNMDDAKMARFYKLVKGITGLTGTEMDIEDTIKTAVTPALSSIIPMFTEYGDLSAISQGKIKVDIFQTVINLTKMNDDKEEDKKLKSSDIIYTLKYLLTSSFDNAVEDEYTWKDQYMKTGDVTTTYKPADVTEYTLVDYRQALLDEIADKYLLDLKKGTEDEITFEELMKIFGIGGTSDKNFNDLVDAGGLGALADRNDIKVIITDRMLGAMLDAQVSSLIGSDTSIGTMMPQVYQTKIIVTEGKTFLEAGIALDIASVFSSAGDIADMLSGILTDKIMITFRIEITITDDEDYEYAQGTVGFNDLTKAETDRLLSILSKFGIELSKNDILTQIEAPMRDSMKSMSDLMPGLEFETSAILMADLFDLTLAKLINTGEKDPLQYDSDDDSIEDTEFIGADLKEVIKELYKVTDDTGFTEPSFNQHSFLENVINNYFITGLTVGDGEGENEVSNFTELSGKFNMDTIDASRVNVDLLMHTSKTNDQLRPALTSAELGRLILDMMSGDEFKNFKDMVSIEITENNTLDMIIKINTKELFNNQEGDFNKFISVSELFVYVSIDLDESNKTAYDSDNNGTDDSYSYKTEITINGMTKTQLAKFNAVVNHFNSSDAGNSLDLTARAKDIGYYMYKQLFDIKDSMGENVDFEDGKLYMASIFDLIAQTQKGSDGKPAETEDVRGALQGLYQVDAAEGKENSDSNYTTDFIYNEIATSAEIALRIGAIAGGADILDNELAYLLTNSITGVPNMPVIPAMTVDTGTMKFRQLNIYSSERTANLVTKFNTELKINEGCEYLEFVFEVKNFASDSSTNKFSSFIPTVVYMTLVVEFDGTDYTRAKFTNGEDYFKINDLSYDEQLVLFDIAKVKDTAIKTQIDNALIIFEDNFFNGKTYGADSNVGTLIQA